MSSRMSSSLTYDAKRYPPLHEGSTALYKSIMLSSALLILSFFVTIFVFRAMYLGYIPCKSEVDCVYGKKSIDAGISSEGCHPVCQNKECVNTAALMLGFMDTIVDPCEDFYNFACGNFAKYALGELQEDAFIFAIKKQLFADVKNMIEDSPRTVPEGELGTSFAKVKRIYDSCVNYVSREGKAPFIVLLYLEKFGIKNWPHLDSNFTFTESVEETLSYFVTYRGFSFFELYIIPEVDAGMQNEALNEEHKLPQREIEVALSWQTNFTMIPGSNKELREEIAISVFRYFGLSDESSKIYAEEVMDFDMKLFYTMQKYRIISPNETSEHSTPELQCDLEQSEEMKTWCTTVKKVFEKTGLSKINPKKTYIMYNKLFFKEIGKMLSNTPDRIIAQALALQFIISNAADLNLKIRTSLHGGNNPKFTEFETSWEYCIQWILGVHSNVLGVEYYTEIYSEKLHMEAKEILEDIKNSTKEISQESTWIEKSSSDFLVLLVENIYANFDMFIKYATNYSVIDEFYEKLPVHDDSFFSNAMEFKRFWFSSCLLYTMENKRIPIHQMNSFDINLLFAGRSLGINLGFLIFPMITPNRPRCVNLGHFGSILAHEIRHGIESYVDSNGNKSERFTTVLNGKRECLLDHSSQYEIDDINVMVNSTYAFSVTTADQIGLNTVLRALQYYHRKHGDGKRLPKMNFTDEQILFLSFAQNYCETNQFEALKEYAMDQPSPSIYRIFGTLRSNPAFSEAFHCPVGSFMNQAEKYHFLP